MSALSDAVKGKVMKTEKMTVDSDNVLVDGESDTFHLPNDFIRQMNKYHDPVSSAEGFSYVLGAALVSGGTIAYAALSIAAGIDFFSIALTSLGVGVSVFSNFHLSKFLKKAALKLEKSAQQIGEGLVVWAQSKHGVNLILDEDFASKYSQSLRIQNLKFRSDSGAEYALNYPGELYEIRPVGASHTLTSPISDTHTNLSLPPETKALLEGIEKNVKALQTVTVDVDSSHTIARAREDTRRALELQEQLAGLYVDSDAKASINPMLELLDEELKAVVVREQKVVQDKIAAQYEYIKTRKNH